MPYLSPEESYCVIEPKSLDGFVETPHVKEIVARALNYIKAGFPIHFRGISGTGKTTLAMHVASQLSRPVVLLHGDDQTSTADLVGGEHGYRRKFLKDNFVARVLKIEESMTKQWVDNRLTIACKNGFTLIYDEFTRSKPEANNILLSVLQEKIMDLPSAREGKESYLKVHPNFTAIFTSNPEEYAGVHKSQDALRDRMITLDLDYMDRETEVEITRKKSGIDRKDAEIVVNIIRDLRSSGQYEFAPTIRGAIMIARSLNNNGCKVSAHDPKFIHICKDILASETSRLGTKAHAEKVKTLVAKLIKKHCTNGYWPFSKVI